MDKLHPFLPSSIFHTSDKTSDPVETYEEGLAHSTA
jgi:hypothetical protein